MINTLCKTFLEDESGQGITEYGAILAFVAILIAIVYGAVSNNLNQAISAAFSEVVLQLNNMTTAAS